MIEVCNKKDAHVQRAYAELVENKETTIQFSPDLFNEARPLFEQLGVGYISVVNEKNERLFGLINKMDCYRDDNRITRYINCNYDGCDLVREKQYLDTDIIDMYDTFVFYRLEEYTFAIARFITECYPEKNVIFMDSTASLFNENWRIIDDEEMLLKQAGGVTLNVTSEYRTYDNTAKTVPCIMVNVISSITLMINLTWARKRSSFGPLNKDKTIVIVDYPALGGGMGDIIKTVQGYIQLVRKKGWIPVVRLNRRNQYLDSYEDNMWEYYFDNVSEVTLDEALKSYNVICGDINNFAYLPAEYLLGVNPHANKNIKVNFNDSTQKYIKENVPHELRENKKVLGVIARGTDLDGGGGRNISRFVRYCRNEYDKGYDYIFLASEDEGYYEAFYNEFEDRLICIPQERIKYDYQNNKYAMICALFHWKSGERKAWGMKYLLITYCLSLCDSLLSTYHCGAWYLAHCWKNGDYVAEGIMARNAFDNIHKADKVEMCCRIGVSRLIADNSLTVIYGTGLDARTWIPVNENTRDKIIFCDKKATEVQYKFKGIDVIKPMDIVDEYRENNIIIASTGYEAEIEQELIELGVDKKRMRTLGQLEAEGERILRDKLEQDENWL